MNDMRYFFWLDLLKNFKTMDLTLPKLSWHCHCASLVRADGGTHRPMRWNQSDADRGSGSQKLVVESSMGGKDFLGPWSWSSQIHLYTMNKMYCWHWYVQCTREIIAAIIIWHLIRTDHIKLKLSRHDFAFCICKQETLFPNIEFHRLPLKTNSDNYTAERWAVPFLFCASAILTTKIPLDIRFWSFVLSKLYFFGIA